MAVSDSRDAVASACTLGEWIAAPAEKRRDAESGIPFDVLTGGIGNNTHIYFNRANFADDGKQVIFRSDRTGSWQLYAYDIARQRLRRLTPDYSPTAGG